MAKAKMPLFSLEASGALGGLEYKHGIYGNVVSRRSISSNRASQAQLTNRAKFGRAVHYWANLSDADRDAWNSVLLSPEDLKAEVIACFMRYPEIEGWPVSPGQPINRTIAFSAAAIYWNPPTWPWLDLSVQSPTFRSFYVNYFWHRLPYIGASVDRAKMQLISSGTWLDAGILLTPSPGILVYRIGIEICDEISGLLIGSWTFDVTPSDDVYLIVYPNVAPPAT